MVFGGVFGYMDCDFAEVIVNSIRIVPIAELLVYILCV